ncbi:hypothetical protein IAD21_03020 [Abditibacteriota bacterium]|nr:hypothetical protein IAD21_03020 [Abditibacteriota bacterium]
MIRFFRVLARGLGWLLRTRVLRPVLAFTVFVWVLDVLVTTATDAAWFSSVGMEALWREELSWSMGVGVIFVIVGLLVGVPLMRAVARPVADAIEEPALPRALARWQTLRARATRLGWLCIAGMAIFLGRGLSLRWSEFALASTASGVKGGIADFWMMRAPAIQSSLAAAWAFALALGVVALGAGALRALPFLAALPSVVPMRWLRALWGVGAALCVLRALGFAFEAMRHWQIANDSAAARVGFVLFNGFGAVGCAIILARLRRPRPTLVLVVAAVIVLPALGGDVLAPFVGRSSLIPPAPDSLEMASRTPDDWPQWDEATLIRAARLHAGTDNKNLIEWQRAGISLGRDGRGSRADIAGTPVLTDEWAGHGLTDREGGIMWKSLDLPETRSVRQEPPLGPSWYGLTARPLLSMDARDVGVPFQSWFWKLAWAWRLRDPLLLVEGARSERLLVVRGAREVGQKLAPFWSWDDVVPRRDPQTGGAYFECVAYCSSPRLPRRAPFENGIFAGQNMVSPVAVLRLDARSGAIQLAPFANSNSQLSHWKAALPSLFGSAASAFAPTPALEVALANGTSLVWIRTPAGWQKKALPLYLRGGIEKKLDEFAGIAATKLLNHLDGATPMLWHQGGELFLAQAFFDFELSSRGRIEMDTEAFPPVVGVVAGPLNEGGASWSTTFEGARTALGSPPSKATITAPFDAATRPASDLLQAALEAGDAAEEALKAGRYVESEKQRTRMKTLLEELRRRR